MVVRRAVTMMDRAKTDHCRRRKRRRRQGWWWLNFLLSGLLAFIGTHACLRSRGEITPSPRVNCKARESESRQLTLHSPTSERDSVLFLILNARSLQTSGCITAIYQSDPVQTAKKNTAGSLTLEYTHYSSLLPSTVERIDAEQTKSKFDDNAIYYALGFFVFILLIRINQLIQFFRFRIYVQGGELIVISGVLSKTQTILPLERVQSVHLKQNYLHRFTNTCGLKLETAGSAHTEVEIDAIDLHKAMALQQLLQQLKKLLR